ncbi:hypothetical protein CALCODRAFT_127768 [Calocera cornea HHB12733]|uniref:Uncharacterized protein n=1 Tax=Calocera cornea HHB12733 TaxID=1353952 RepID=A0A165I952_9BASI|nr:hypothetical protein CALCODRAFT_127768 [Calocera cornea HHB12733]
MPRVGEVGCRAAKWWWGERESDIRTSVPRAELLMSASSSRYLPYGHRLSGLLGISLKSRLRAIIGAPTWLCSTGSTPVDVLLCSKAQSSLTGPACLPGMSSLASACVLCSICISTGCSCCGMPHGRSNIEGK